MHNVDISNYKIANNEKIIYYGSAVIKTGYRIVAGDERFYQFVGDNACYSITELIFGDDVEEFTKALENMGDEEVVCIVRIKCYNDTYRYVATFMRKNGRIVENAECFDLYFYDILSIKEKFFGYADNVDKYRQFMSLSNDIYFEYYREIDEVLIYRYQNMKSIPIIRSTLDEALKQYEGKYIFSNASNTGFDKICEVLRSGVDHFNVTVDASINDEKMERVQYVFKGKVLETIEKKKYTVGVIEVRGVSISEKECYYLSDNALDAGTGVFNKRAINEYAVEKIGEKLQNKGSMYLAILDVDDFKQINDRFGHMYGDEVLQKVADIIQTVLTTRGFVGRFGGDEFMVVFNDISDEDTLRTIIKTITKQISWYYSETLVSVTTSWGISKFPDDGTNYEDLFLIADKCLYIAKQKGKNRFIIYDEKKHGAIENENTLLRNIGIKAIESEEKKAEIMSDIVFELSQNGVTALSASMATMREYFDIDGIAIYVGDDMRRVFEDGNYVNPIQNLVCMKDEAYLRLFDEKGMYMESRMDRLSATYINAYNLYTSQENGKFIQFVAFEDEVPKAVVAFDFFNRSPKYGKSDLGMITIVGRIMARIALNIK